MNTISIAVPVFEEEKNLNELFNKIEKIEATILKDNIKLEIILGDNSSKDKSWQIIKNWSTKKNNSIAVRYSKNIGFQSSILQMMKIARGDAFIILQSDLQDPPELIYNFITEWRKGSKIVAGVIKRRKENWIDRLGRKIFYNFMHITSDGRVQRNIQDFYLLDKEVYKEISDKEDRKELKKGDIFPTKEGTYIVYVGNNHKWHHLSKKLYDLLLSFKNKTVTIVGGADGECLEDIVTSAETLDVKIKRDYKYIYTANSCPI